MNIYQTIASVGKYAPLFRARSQVEALGLIRTFEQTMQCHGLACKLGISGVFQNHQNPVKWARDYADIDSPVQVIRTGNRKPSDKVDSFYRVEKAGVVTYTDINGNPISVETKQAEIALMLGSI